MPRVEHDPYELGYVRFPEWPAATACVLVHAAGAAEWVVALPAGPDDPDAVVLPAAGVEEPVTFQKVTLPRFAAAARNPAPRGAALFGWQTRGEHEGFDPADLLAAVPPGLMVAPGHASPPPRLPAVMDADAGELTDAVRRVVIRERPPDHGGRAPGAPDAGHGQQDRSPTPAAGAFTRVELLLQEVLDRVKASETAQVEFEDEMRQRVAGLESAPATVAPARGPAEPQLFGIGTDTRNDGIRDARDAAARLAGPPPRARPPAGGCAPPAQTGGGPAGPVPPDADQAARLLNGLSLLLARSPARGTEYEDDYNEAAAVGTGGQRVPPWEVQRERFFAHPQAAWEDWNSKAASTLGRQGAPAWGGGWRAEDTLPRVPFGTHGTAKRAYLLLSKIHEALAAEDLALSRGLTVQGMRYLEQLARDEGDAELAWTFTFLPDPIGVRCQDAEADGALDPYGGFANHSQVRAGVSRVTEKEKMEKRRKERKRGGHQPPKH